MDDKRKAGRPYLIFFASVCVLFIGLLIFVYRVTCKVNPVMLDEHGKTVAPR